MNLIIFVFGMNGSFNHSKVHHDRYVFSLFYRNEEKKVISLKRKCNTSIVFVSFPRSLQYLIRQRIFVCLLDISLNKMSLSVGSDAPEFTLYNTEQKEISLKDLRSKSNVVILFFPLAFTGVCTAELCSARDDIAKYQKLNATIVGISIDSLFTLGKFREEQKLPFDLLSDFNKDVSRQYDSLYEQFPLFGLKGVTKRSAFIVDKQGQIQYAEILADPGKVPNFDQIKQTLEKLNE